jgi:hypothetical protein
MNGHQDLCAALLGLRRPSPGRPPPVPGRAPARGPVVGREPGTPPRTDAPSTANPHAARKEVKAVSRPSLEELQRQVEEDGGCEATDGCWVEPDGHCEHGEPSWLLALGLI